MGVFVPDPASFQFMVCLILAEEPANGPITKASKTGKAALALFDWNCPSANWQRKSELTVLTGA